MNTPQDLDPTNPYDRIRLEIREKQEKERKQRETTSDIFKQVEMPGTLSERLKGERK